MLRKMHKFRLTFVGNVLWLVPDAHLIFNRRFRVNLFEPYHTNIFDIHWYTLIYIDIHWYALIKYIQKIFEMYGTQRKLTVWWPFFVEDLFSLNMADSGFAHVCTCCLSFLSYIWPFISKPQYGKERLR